MGVAQAGLTAARDRVTSPAQILGRVHSTACRSGCQAAGAVKADKGFSSFTGPFCLTTAATAAYNVMSLERGLLAREYVVPQ